MTYNLLGFKYTMAQTSCQPLNKYILSSRRKSRENRDLFFNSLSISKNVDGGPLRFLGYLSKGAINILDRLLWCKLSHEHVYVSQKTLASWTGLTREHVCRLIKMLDAYSIITKRRCPYQSNVYTFDNVFDNPDVLFSLRNVFSSIRSFFSKKITLLGLGERNNKYITVTTKKGISAVSSILDKLKTKVYLWYMSKKIPDGNPISVAIRAIEFLNLTKWGQIKLSAFPDEAIEYADRQAKYATHVKCMQYCNDNELEPDLHYVDSLVHHYGITKRDTERTLKRVEHKQFHNTLGNSRKRTSQKERGYVMKTNAEHVEGRQKRHSSYTKQKIVEIPIDDLAKSAEGAMHDEQYLASCKFLGMDPLHVFNRTHTLVAG